MHEAIGAENYIDFCEFFLSLWARKKGFVVLGERFNCRREELD